MTRRAVKMSELPIEELYSSLRTADGDPAEVEDLDLNELTLFAEAKVGDAPRKFESQEPRDRLCEEFEILLALSVPVVCPVS
jgi:hypothetical protein